MPRFSVVVPAYRVQGFLRPCLESVLGQSYGDLELIVVDDRSPDACAAITAEYAERDARVLPLRLPVHSGTGAARNAGAARACGDYLLFLDGDDLLLDGALAALAARIDGTGDPELLLFDHARLDWWDTVHDSGDSARLGAGGAAPDPAAVTVAAWNRLFRRDFLHRHELRFTEGPYEDVVPVHLATALAGERAATLDRVCVHWRQRRAGSAATTPGRHHFAILERYRALFAELPDPERRAALLPHAARHLLTVLDDPGRIRPADRKEFFRAAARFHRDHAPTAAAAAASSTVLTASTAPTASTVPTASTAPADDWGPRLRALASGSYAAHEALRTADEQLARGREALLRRKRTLRGTVLRGAYRADRWWPLDDRLVVYGAYWNRGVACNPAAIHRKAQELAPHLRGVWVVGSRYADRMPPGVPHVIEGSRAYWRVMARARYLVNNSAFPGGFTKRPGQIYLQTHHGTPLKKMGLDQRRYPAGTHGISFTKLLDHADQWDYSLSANRHSTEVWERVYPSAFRALETGYPRNDVYATAGPEDVARARAALGIAPGRTAILYAPTHRDYQRGFLPRVDLERLSRELGPGVTVLVRAHYFYGADPALAELQRRGLVLDVTDHPSVEDLCLAADALVTDYSSIMFDYANLDRPIIVYAPDWQAYSLSRGTYFDPLSGLPGETPGATATSESQLIDLFRSGGWNTDETAKLRAAFRDRFCPYDDGGAAERVVRRLFLEER
ncbi:CDP-glycerol:glycerophosphate glycerophosphotransferase [Streptomyces sp. URMC 123]|uniref:CDP-glycerol:glycerophosphate glycerophosphotransferase n=1 Tax=Streptomyces sp. URMC 123 TaxID=3423403 RepID=UPI003F1D49DB